MGDKIVRLEVSEYVDGYWAGNLFRTDLEPSKIKLILDLLLDRGLKNTGQSVSESIQNCSKEPVVSESNGLRIEIKISKSE